MLTEGLFDWLTLAQWGLPACAALATQGAERIAAALRGFPRVFLAFDADDAGRSAAERLAELLGRRSAVLSLPHEAADVAELATRPHGYGTFLRLLRQAAREAA
ncbi:MAG: toprim domain-containing protein [Chloroflexota bacterium]|nr:toprim domain-containing protein [Chloroflexota bacterium]MDE2884832.1 toprim domain-containing protein [Chloroflexota bacterium]